LESIYIVGLEIIELKYKKSLIILKIYKLTYSNLRINLPKGFIHGLLIDREQKETIIPPVFGKEMQN